MKTILLLTVGGSHTPILNAIREYQPDFIYFICSTGDRGSEKTVDGLGKPCGDARKCPHCGGTLGKTEKSIVAQLDWGEDAYKKMLLNDPDDIDECYKKISETLEEIRLQYGDSARIIANYTGGTKTMSVVLALLGVITPGCELSLNKGPRSDLVKVITGDVPVAVDTWNIFAQMQLDTVREFLDNFNYAGANDVLSQLSKRPLEKGIQSKIIHLRLLCQAFDAWDKFNHQKAGDLLSLSGSKALAPFIIALKRIMATGKNHHGYEKVADLVLNSRRRAKQQRYDDAVARLYRATELLAQIRLRKEKQIDSGDVSIEQLELPQNIREKYEARRKNGKIAIGLTDTYELLAILNDPVGELYRNRKNKILNAIKKRNFSILAHGTAPISETEYKEVEGVLVSFIDETLNMIGADHDIPQLPQGNLLDFSS